MKLTEFISKIFAIDLTEQQALLLEMYEEMKYIKPTQFYTPNITRNPIKYFETNSGFSECTSKELFDKIQGAKYPNT